MELSWAWGSPCVGGRCQLLHGCAQPGRKYLCFLCWGCKHCWARPGTTWRSPVSETGPRVLQNFWQSGS